MNDYPCVSVVLTLLLSVGCGPKPQRDPPSSDSTTSGNGVGSSSSATGDGSGVGSTGVGTGIGSTSSADTGGTSSNCEGWMPPPVPPWSYQDCLTDECPEGEVCRYNPGEDCGAHPVCVNPTTYQCFCERNDDLGDACPCPGYVFPPDYMGGGVPLECNTGMSSQPVTNNVPCGPP